MSKIMRVFYDNAGLPYKDSALSIHYPILEGGEFVGANNTTDIYFYTANLGDFYFVANCKLPNGALVDKLLVHGSDEFGEYFALSLDSELTENKGHLKVALKGYGGNVDIEEEQDGDTTIVVINGTPTIVATGIVDIAINYAPLVHYISSLTPSEYEQLLAAIGSKLDITKGIYVIADRTISATQFSEGQLVYSKADKLFYRVTSNAYVLEQVDIGSINVGGDTLANRLSTLAGDISDLEGDVNDLDTNKADKVGILPHYEVQVSTNVAQFINDNNLSSKPIIVSITGINRTLVGVVTTYNNTVSSFELRDLRSKNRFVGNNIDGSNFTFGSLASNTYRKNFELEENKVPSISSSSTDDDYPSAKAVYNVQQELTLAINSSGHSIVASINRTNYVMTIALKDAFGNTLGTAQDIDLPLESIIVSAEYHDTYTYDGEDYEKVIVITLQTTPVPTIVPVGALVSGLVNETQLTTALALKADKSTTYTKTEVDNALDLKADKLGTLPYLSVTPTTNMAQFVTMQHNINNHVSVILKDVGSGRTFLAAFSYIPSLPTMSFEIEEVGTENRWQGQGVPTSTFRDMTFYDCVEIGGPYQNNFELVKNKVDLSSSNTTSQYPNAKSVYDNLQNVREVAEGKCKTFVLSYDDDIATAKYIIQSVSQSTKFMVYNTSTKEFEDKTAELLNGEYDNVSTDNYKFNLQNNSIGTSGALIFRSISGLTRKPEVPNPSFWFVRSFYGFVLNKEAKVGDVVYVLEQGVPDRWVSDVDVTTTFSPLEAKGDLSNYYTKAEVDSWFTDVTIDEE